MSNKLFNAIKRKVAVAKSFSLVALDWVMLGLVAAGAASVALLMVVAAWMFGPALAALLVGIPLWLLWNWLAPVYLVTLPAVMLHLPYAHVAAVIIGIVLMKRLFTKTALPKVSAR